MSFLNALGNYPRSECGRELELNRTIDRVERFHYHFRCRQTRCLTKSSKLPERVGGQHSICKSMMKRQKSRQCRASCTACRSELLCSNTSPWLLIRCIAHRLFLLLCEMQEIVVQKNRQFWHSPNCLFKSHPRCHSWSICRILKTPPMRMAQLHDGWDAVHFKIHKQSNDIPLSALLTTFTESYLLNSNSLMPARVQQAKEGSTHVLCSDISHDCSIRLLSNLSIWNGNGQSDGRENKEIPFRLWCNISQRVADHRAFAIVSPHFVLIFVLIFQCLDFPLEINEKQMMRMLPNEY